MALSFQVKSLSRAWDEAKEYVRTFRMYLVELRDRAAVQNVGATDFVTLYLKLVSHKAAISSDWNLPGLQAWARNAENDATIDLTALRDTIVTEITDCLNFLDGAGGVPRDGNGWILLYKLDQTNGQTARTFTPAQTANLRTEMTAIINAIPW